MTVDKQPPKKGEAVDISNKGENGMTKKSMQKTELELVLAKDDNPAKSDSPKGSKSSSMGTSRGIESMFRNSYRAQLDMLALAATKANIMISLNGLLVSILLVSGTYFLGVEPTLIVPLVAFLLTCTTAIVFAVLAARPAINKDKHTLEEFRKDAADLLVFEQFAKLPREDYLDAMQEMVRSNDRIYNNMIVHIHGMGLTADRKFTRLYISYSAFMIGLVISVLLLLGVITRAAMTAGV